MSATPGVDGPRPARLDELDEVIRLTNAVFRTADGLAPTMGDEFPLFFCADNIDNLYVIRRENAVVSHVGVYEQTMKLRGIPLRIACVGAACTHLEHRGRGYAGALMDLAIERARASGNALMLISGDAGLYLGRGATRIAHMYRGHLRAEALADVSTSAVRAYRTDDLDAVVQLNGTRAEHYVWMPSDVETLITMHLNFGGRAWVYDQEGAIAGFLLVRHQPPWQWEPGDGKVVEVLGGVNTTRSLSAAAVRELALQALEFKTLLTHHGRRRTLEAIGVVCTAEPSEWTVKVLDLPAVLDAVNAPSTEPSTVVLRAEREALAIVAGDETTRVAETDAINAILFSEPDAWPEVVDRLDASARAELARVVPLPLCSYGLNYV